MSLTEGIAELRFYYIEESASSDKVTSSGAVEPGTLTCRRVTD